MTEVRKVDQTAIKVGQGATIILLLLAFISSQWWLVTLVGIAQLFGALAVPFAPYRLLYLGLKNAGLLKPNPQPDNPEPHRFSMLLGAIFNGIGTILLVSGATFAGWIPVWIVIALANLNFWIGFCAGCWMYYQFNRLGLPGFTVAPVK